MAVKEAEEDDLMDDDDDNADAASVSSDTTVRKSQLVTKMHKCSSKPTVSYELHKFAVVGVKF